ncbi:sensor histidine kinase [Kitasatospora phosalacinea]|uniref:sensor histidine kinase n=1 Tax=Kitasatospora phosalacinea TaxID=2065 RepID=UPI0036595389
MQPEPAILHRLTARLQQPLPADSLFAALYATASLVIGQETPPGPWRSLDAVGAALTVLISAALVARRNAPVTVLAAVIVLWIAYIGCGYWPVVNSPAVLLALYTVAAARGPRTTWVCAVAVGSAWVLSGLLAGESADMPAVLVQACAFPVVIGFLGRAAGRFAESNRRLAELTRLLRAEQDLRAEQAVTEERVRIARELHDVVAHHMSMVSLQAGMASYVFERDPATAKGALETIAVSSREALEELRRMLVLLRVGPQDGARPADAAGLAGGAADLAPAPGLDRLEELLQRMRAAGVPTELRCEGSPFPLPPGMDLCVYRVIQEALTNVLKHAGPAEVTVAIRYSPQTLTVGVTDSGRGADPAVSVPGTGHGLIGMRERAKIYRGTVSAGPRIGGGYEVLLNLPSPAVGDPPHHQQFP